MGKMERKSLPKEKFYAFERIFVKHGDIVEHDGREIQKLCGNFLNLYHVFKDSLKLICIRVLPVGNFFDCWSKLVKFLASLRIT